MIIYDSLYFLLAIPPLLLGLYAQFKVKRTYRKYSKIGNTRNITGREASEEILSRLGASSDTGIKIVAGELNDSYDPVANVLNLSQATANSTSLAAIGIAAHELGHLEQDRSNYGLLGIRTKLVPVVNIGSTIGYLLFIVGILLSFASLTWLGVALFSFTTIFTLVTLPIEFNASSRAMKLIESSNMLASTELAGARAVLSAAALTYVAAAFQSIMNLTYFILRANRD